MSVAQMFPKTVEEFMEEYKMVDKDHVYSNGIEYVPIFRMKQWFEHISSVQPRKGKWTRHFDGNEWYWYCSSCKEQWYEEDLWMGGNSFPNFCPNCGADMREGDAE